MAMRCTKEPSLSCTACQVISEISSGAPAMLRSNVSVLASVNCARNIRAPMLVPDPVVR